MSLTFRIGTGLKSQPLTLDHEGVLNLPSLYLIPDFQSDSFSRVNHLEFTVSGPAETARLIQGAYEGFMDQLQGLAISEPQTLQPWAICPRDTPLQSGSYTLTVNMTVADGPGAAAGTGHQILTASTVLTADQQVNRVGSLSATWKRQLLIAGEGPAILEIAASHLASDATPVVCVDRDASVAPAEWLDAVQRFLNGHRPTHQSGTNRHGQQLFSLSIEPILDRLMIQESSREECRIALKVSADGTTDVIELKGPDAMKVDFCDRMFPGYPVIDLGTSSIFVALVYSGLVTGQLARETESSLRRQLNQWLDTCPLPAMATDWNSLLQLLAGELQLTAAPDESPAAALRRYLRKNTPAPRDPDHAVHELLSQLEIVLFSGCIDPGFRAAFSNLLARMYQHAFRQFPLEHWGFVPIDLNKKARAGESIRESYDFLSHEHTLSGCAIPGHVEVTSTTPLTVDVGHAPQKRWNELEGDPETLLKRLFASAKNFFSMLGSRRERISVQSEETESAVSAREFVAATLRRIRELVEYFRDHSENNDLPSLPFRRAILLFPNSASPAMRREILQAARDAGFDAPVADIDEALSAIVYYLVAPFGADPEMGLEGFRASCRPVLVTNRMAEPFEWKQNILLIDVGGGTTDIALVVSRLIDLRAERASSGENGRYYRLVPELSGATGRRQLGGDTITLRLFHDLKVRIADRILTVLSTDGAVNQLLQNQNPVSPRLRLLLDAVQNLPYEFAPGGRYLPGILLEKSTNMLWANNKAEPLSVLAFSVTDQVVPTSWNGLTAAQRDFRDGTVYSRLWRLSEDLKVKHFGSTETPGSAFISIDQMASLLEIPELRSIPIPPVEISPNDFADAIKPVLRDIADLAVKLVKDRLPDDAWEDQRILDRIILTGQSCRLPQLRRAITEAFNQAQQDLRDSRSGTSSEHGPRGFHWDPTRLTFDPDEAKPAAALGAALVYQFARNRTVASPGTNAPGVKLGANKLDVDINNLLQFIPSGFVLMEAGTRSTHLLSPCQRITETDADGNGIVRSHWDAPMMPTLRLNRFDWENDGGVPWGELDCQAICDQSGMEWHQFARQIRFAIESNYRLDVTALLCNGGQPHLTYPTSVGFSLGTTAARLKPRNPADPEPTDLTPADCFDVLKDWEVGVNMKGAFGQILFRLDRDLMTQTFRKPDGAIVTGLVSEPLHSMPESRTDTFYVRPADGSVDWIEAGQARRASSGIRSDDEMVRVVLDIHGNLALCGGMIPFFTGSDPTCLREPGVVYRARPTDIDIPDDDLLVPRCGRH